MDDLVKTQESDPFKGMVITPDTRLYVTFFTQKIEPCAVTTPVSLSQKGIQILQRTDREVFCTADLFLGKGIIDLMKLPEHEDGSGITIRNWNTTFICSE